VILTVAPEASPCGELMGEMVHERTVVRSTTEGSGKIGASGRIKCIGVPRIFPRARILPKEVPV
jgi:hypothetical protein